MTINYCGFQYFILNKVFLGCFLLGLAYLYGKGGEVYMEGQIGESKVDYIPF